MADKKITENELREMAVEACRKSNGSGWNTMAIGDQEAQIESFIHGYSVGSGRPYFVLLEEGFGGAWKTGKTIVVPAPKKTFQVTREMLERWLVLMERDWKHIDQEWGPTVGGLEAEIVSGDAPEIAEIRALLEENA